MGEPFTLANPVWASELNTDNNQLFVGGTIGTTAPGGGHWSGILGFEGQMTLNGRSAPATIDIFDGVLSGQALDTSLSNPLSFVFTNDAAPTIAGNTISYPIRSDSLLFGNSVYGSGTGTLALTMERRVVGTSATGEVVVTYSGGARFTGRFTGTVVEVAQ